MQSKHAVRVHAALHAFEDPGRREMAADSTEPTELADVEAAQQTAGHIGWQVGIARSHETPVISGNVGQIAQYPSPDRKSSDGGYRNGPGSLHAIHSRGSSSNSQVTFLGDSVSQQNRQTVVVRSLATWLHCD